MENSVYSRTLQLDDKWKNHFPRMSRLDIELTERCNNSCIHCYINLPANDVAAKARELSTEDIKGIIRESASMECLTVRFTGGESLLREDFEELYLFTRKNGFKVVIFTNATLITPDLVKLFARIPPLEKIEITVYGMRRNSYESVTRVSGSYESAWRRISLLLENRIPFIVKGALLPPNLCEIEEFEAWAATIPWMDEPPSYSMFFDFRCRRIQDKNQLIKSLRLTPENALAILARDKERYIDDMKGLFSRFTFPPGEKLFLCGAGLHSGCADAYGCFQPCLMLRHPDTVYSLKDGSLNDAMTNFFPKVREMKATNLGYLARCARCFLRELCEQCPAKSWMEYGTLDTPVEYLCEVTHAQARFLNLIEENEMAWNVKNWKERLKRFTKGK